MQRTDIHQNDVFISWTGNDRELKNQIVSFLRENDISCTESDHDCAGDFRQWSREAVGKCTVFLVLYTENTVNSEFVPVEVEEFLKLDDYKNRCVPVVSDFSLYANNLPQLAQNESAVVLDGCELTQNHLKKILYNVQTLINNRLCKVYCESTKPTYMRLVSMLKAMHVADREFDHNRLYINRTVIDVNGENIIDPKGFIHADDILFLYGPAGCGKSCYIDQLKNAADDKTLVMALPCRKLIDTTDLITSMFTEFRRCCGNRHFYTMDDFKSLLLSRHLLLVLDGLDEIATEKGTRKFLDAVRDYYALNADSTTLFFTSRNESDADLIAINGQTPKKLMLKSLEESQIKVFGENLFLMFGSPNKSDDFYVRIQDFADEIRTNPLLLSQLAIVYDKKNEIPQTTVEIYDAVCEITLSREDDITGVPDDYRDMVTRNLSHILKAFSAERYRLLSLGKQIDTAKILAAIMKNEYADARDRAAFLEEYLRNRAMLIDGEFYHKMLLEYFTAVYHYEKCFDDYDELENTEALKDVFSHYNDPYWSAVLQMFLIKVDNLVDSKTAAELYSELMTYDITEYTLLFDTCRNLVVHKEETQCALLRDIMKKSADGIYPPYGPLFWYVPEYGLYEAALLALDSIQDADCFTKALALTRDVCWIFGHYNTADEITNRVNGKSLLEKAVLSGVRQGLCKLFFAGNTDFALGNDIYPRCFNIAEAKSWKKSGCGVLDRMPNAFEDELGLYSHEMFSELNEEWIGIVATRYDTEHIESVLPSKSCKKLCGLFLSPTADTEMKKLAINGRHIRIMYVPETIKSKERFCFNRTQLELSITVFDGNLVYFRDKVTLPDSTTKIGKFVFEDCTSLISITLPDSITEIGESAFAGCSSLISINIPYGLTKIDWRAFEGCCSLASITLPDSITEIGGEAFSECASLTSISLPDGITEIFVYTFDGCSSLYSITLPNSITEIDSGAFRDCSSLASITLPNRLKRIGYIAFEGCRSLSSITLPDSMTFLDEHAFANCHKIKLIENCLTGYCQKDLGVSDNCVIKYRNANSQTLILPEGVTEIVKKQFAGRRDIVQVQIPKSVTKIGQGAFRDCSSLSSIILPDSIIEIDEMAFAGCCSLSSITLPNSISKISWYAFKGCTSLSSIILPNSITEIGGESFKDCSSLSSIMLPNSITEIGIGAFSGCKLLSSITFPTSVVRIGRWAFTNCCQIKSIHNCPIGYSCEDLGVSNDCVISYRNEDLITVIIPESVTEITKGQFAGRRDIVQVQIPKSVTKIGEKSFFECGSLTSIALPNNIAEIGKYAFYGCSLLSSITLSENVSKIGESVFGNCKSLISITIPRNVKKIGNHAFRNCCSLVSINLPDDLKEIGFYAFEGCYSLASINLPNGLSEIGFGAFEGCKSLLSITISEDVKKIGENAFDGCSSLSSVTIPTSVRILGDNAFGNCTGLRGISVSRRFEDDLPRIFSGVDLSNVKINWL